MTMLEVGGAYVGGAHILWSPLGLAVFSTLILIFIDDLLHGLSSLGLLRPKALHMI